MLGKGSARSKLLIFKERNSIEFVKSFCRCCVETVAKEVEEALEEQEEIRLEDGVLKVPPKAETDEEPVEHSYCWNFFSHFAIPIFVYIILYCMLLGRGWKFAFSEM